MTRSSIQAALLALALAAPAAAHAQDSAMTVRVSDLNLASVQGADAARHRIRAAAGRFCGAGEARDLTRISLQRGCVAQMSRKASRQLDQAMLAARPFRLANRDAN